MLKKRGKIFNKSNHKKMKKIRIISIMINKNFNLQKSKENKKNRKNKKNKKFGI